VDRCGKSVMTIRWIEALSRAIRAARTLRCDAYPTSGHPYKRKSIESGRSVGWTSLKQPLQRAILGAVRGTRGIYRIRSRVERHTSGVSSGVQNVKCEVEVRLAAAVQQSLFDRVRLDALQGVDARVFRRHSPAHVFDDEE